MSKKKQIGCVVALLVAILAAYFSGGPLYYYSDPIRARVIDEHTGQPLPGVVVVAVWTLGHWHSSSHFHAAEAVSDQDGYFTVPAMPKKIRPFGGWLDWRDPWMYLYKPGYQLAQRHNKDAYIHPVTAPGEWVKTTTTPDGHIISDVSSYSGTSKRFSYWHGKTIPLMPTEGDLKKEAESLDSMMSLAQGDRLNPPEFPSLWRGIVAGYDRLPASVRPLGMADARELMKARIAWP